MLYEWRLEFAMKESHGGVVFVENAAKLRKNAGWRDIQRELIREEG